MASSIDIIPTLSTESEDTTPQNLPQNLGQQALDSEEEVLEAEATDTEVSEARASLERAQPGIERICCSSVRGNFYEEGGSLNDNHRHGQLNSLFTVNKKIDEVVSENKTLKAQIAQAEKSGPTSNKKLMDTMAVIVEQKFAPQLRDLTIRNERLEEELKDVKARNEKLEQRVKDRDGKENGKLKKYEEQIAGLSRTVRKGADERVKYDNQLQALTKRLESSERTEKETVEEIYQLKQSHATLDKRVDSTEEEAGASQARQQGQAEDITRLTNDLESTKGVLDSFKAEVGNQRAHVDEELGQVKDSLEDDRYKWSDTDSRLQRFASRHRRLSDFVTRENDVCRRDADDFDRRLRRLERR